MSGKVDIRINLIFVSVVVTVPCMVFEAVGG